MWCFSASHRRTTGLAFKRLVDVSVDDQGGPETLPNMSALPKRLIFRVPVLSDPRLTLPHLSHFFAGVAIAGPLYAASNLITPQTFCTPTVSR